MKKILYQQFCWLILVALITLFSTGESFAQTDSFKGDQAATGQLNPSRSFNNTSYSLDILTGSSFTWQEINQTGTELSFAPDRDDGHSFLASILSFDFPFFGSNERNLAIGTNGTVYFEDEYLGLNATPIPGPTSYPPVDRFIAHLWTDLALLPSSSVYYQDFGTYAVVQYDKVEKYGGNGSTAGTWQIVITAEGSIILKYNDISLVNTLSSIAGLVGIQGSESEGFAIGEPLSDDMALCLRPDTGNAFCSTSTLPVEFVDLDAYTLNDEIIVSWITASEEGNAGFEIQANNGAGYRTIGYVDGKGTTDVDSEYSFRTEILSPDFYQIRIKQFDFDGSFSYSDETELEIKVTKGFVLNQVYPNPFRGETSFTFAVGVDQRVRVELFDLLGKKLSTLLEEELRANKTRSLRIDGSGLDSGVYIVRVTGDQFSATRTVNLLK